MQRLLAGLALSLFIAAPATAMELVANGAFEQELEPAWTVETAGVAAFTVRATTLQPDPDYEVLVQKDSGNGHAKVYQTIVVPSVDLALSVTARFQSAADFGEAHPWAAAAVMIYYEDQFGGLQGTTCIGRLTGYCPWANTGTFHIIPAANENWNTYTLSIADELQNFPAAASDQVTRIRIVLAAVVGADC
jgi:hypothetical protein